VPGSSCHLLQCAIEGGSVPVLRLVAPRISKTDDFQALFHIWHVFRITECGMAKNSTGRPRGDISFARENVLDMLTCLLALHRERWIGDAVHTAYCHRRRAHSGKASLVAMSVSPADETATVKLLLEPPPSPPLFVSTAWDEHAENNASLRSYALTRHVLGMFDVEDSVGQTALRRAVHAGSVVFLRLVAEALDEVGISFADVETHAAASVASSNVLRKPRPELFLLAHLAMQQNVQQGEGEGEGAQGKAKSLLGSEGGNKGDIDDTVTIENASAVVFGTAWAHALAPSLHPKNARRVSRPTDHPVPPNVAGGEESTMFVEREFEIQEWGREKIGIKGVLLYLEEITDRIARYDKAKGAK
jgi:hypothetical protein